MTKRARKVDESLELCPLCGSFAYRKGYMKDFIGCSNHDCEHSEAFFPIEVWQKGVDIQGKV